MKEISSLEWISSVSLNHIIFKTVPQKQIPGDDAAGEFVLEKISMLVLPNLASIVEFISVWVFQIYPSSQRLNNNVKMAHKSLLKYFF